MCVCALVCMFLHMRVRGRMRVHVCIPSCACVCTCTYGVARLLDRELRRCPKASSVRTGISGWPSVWWGMGNIDLGTGRLFVLATLRAVQRQQSGKLPLLLRIETHGRSRKEEARACARPATDFERDEESQAPASNRWAMADQRSRADGSASTDYDARWRAYHRHGILEVTT